MREKEVTFGRSSRNNVVIQDDYVSGIHCKIIQDDYGFTVIDLGSENGTIVNEMKIKNTQKTLHPNDVVKIGYTTLEWQKYFVNKPPTTDIRIKPDNWLVWSILSTIFCCLPFGIVSIIYAAKVNSLWRSGDKNGAITAADNAKKWFWWSVGVAAFCWLAYIIYYFAVMRSMFRGLW
jgi:hypothetical protein